MKKVILGILSFLIVCTLSASIISAPTASIQEDAIADTIPVDLSELGYYTFSNGDAINFETVISNRFGEDKDGNFAIGESVILPRVTYDSTIYELTVLVQNGGKIFNAYTDFVGGESFKLSEQGTYNVIYVLKNEQGSLKSYSVNITASDKAYIEAEDYLTDFATGKTYYIPKAKAIKGDTKADAIATLVAPNGQEVNIDSENNAEITQKGVYTLTYSATIDGQSLTTVVKLVSAYGGDGLFTVVKGDGEVTGGVDLPAYSTPGNGVRLVSASSGTVFRFSNCLDITNLTKDKNLIEFQILSTGEWSTLQNIYVTLVDKYDSKNTIKTKFFVFKPYPDVIAQCYVLTTHDGTYKALSNTSSEGVHVESEQERYTNTPGWFDASKGGGAKNAALVSLQFDTAESQSWVYKGIKQYPTMLLDYDDYRQVGEGNEWKGFTTGEVYLEISFDGNVGDGGLIVTEVCGQSLSNRQINDTVAPTLTVQTAQNYLESGIMPTAQVNKAYPIPKANALDYITGACAVDVKVVHTSTNTDKTSLISGNTFTPDVVGNYKLTYSAIDAIGNRVEKVFDFECVQTVSKIEIGFASPLSVAKAGNYYTIPEIIATGGSGNKEISFEIKLNGETLSTNKYEKIFLSAVGELTVEVQVSDYIGTEVLDNVIEIPVSADALPVITVKGMPDFAKIGSTVIFPDFTAIDYNFDEGESGYTPTKTITVNGTTLGADRAYTVKNTDSVLNVVYSAGSAQSAFTVKVFGAQSVKEYLQFSSTPVSVTGETSSVNVVVDTDTTIYFPYEVLTTELVIDFSVNPEKADFSNITVTLEDFYDETKKVTFRVSKNDENYSNLIINGNTDNVIKIEGSFMNQSKNISLLFNGREGKLIRNGKAIANVTTFVGGEKFTGFTGFLARAYIDIEGVTGQGSINIIRLANQVFNKQNVDLFGPFIATETVIDSMTITKDQTLYLPKGFASDVLSGQRSVKTTLTGPSGTVIFSESDFAGKDYQFTQYGIYKLSYLSVDASNRREEKLVYINVRDSQPPQIILSHEIVESAKLNDKIIIPTVTVSDNVSALDKISVTVTVFDPGRVSVRLEEGKEYQFTQKGFYTITVMAWDEAHNYAIKSYNVQVG